MKPSLQTFMSPGDTRTVPRRMYKADVNPDSDYRQWATLKHSAVDRCTSDTQLQLHNVESDSVTCEPQEQQAQTVVEVVENTEKEEREQSFNLVQSTQRTQTLGENSSHVQNVEQESLPESPRSIHSVHA